LLTVLDVESSYASALLTALLSEFFVNYLTNLSFSVTFEREMEVTWSTLRSSRADVMKGWVFFLEVEES
jgi:hypothetical protein